MYLSDTVYGAILNNTSEVVTYYNSMRDAFIQDLGMQGLSESAVKAAWCSVVAYGLKPYGPEPLTKDLAPILESPTLACDLYVTLTWYLYNEFGLATDDLTAVGWDNGAVGNHAQLLYNDGTSNLLLDPTIGLVVNGVAFLDLVYGSTYNEYASFYSRTDLDYFNTAVISAVTSGAYRVWDTFYRVPTFDNWINHYSDYLGLTLENGNDSQTIVGFVTNDSIYGGLGDDIIYGVKGNDFIDGGIGADQMYGGLGNDSFFIDDVGDVAYENLNEGLDTAYFSTPTYTLGDNIENAYINTVGAANATGNGLNNVIYAGAGNNVIDGGAGNDTVSYYYSSGKVNVSLSVVTAQDTLGSGSDTLIGVENLVGSNAGDDSLAGNNAANVLQGMGGNDALYGLAGNDTLYGDAGNDFLNGGTGADQMYGGLGNDSFFIDDVGDVAYENLNEGLDTAYFSTPTYTLGDNIENAYINTVGAANATGNGLNNVIYAGAGNNVIDGGAGNDTVSYYYSSGKVNVSLSVVTAQDTLGSGSDTLIGVENLVGSNAGDDSLAGNNAANVLQGMGGNDALYGLAGNDTLYGDAGNDFLNGGTGADQMYGGLGNDSFFIDDVGDVAYENLNEGLDTAYFSTPAYTLGDNIENAYINTVGAANATGNGLNNVIYAGAGNNVIDGGAGNDTVSYYYSSGKVNVSLSVVTAQDTLGSGSDTLIGVENLVGSNAGDDSLAGNNAANVLQGMGGNDALYGLAGNDTLYGDAGNDFLNGGTGADQMYGGLGNDSFFIDDVGDVAYENLNEGLDTAYFSTPAYTLGDNIENAYVPGQL